MKRWTPKVECSDQEKRLLKLVGKSRKLFVFLREHRHQIFAEAFQEELEAMYRDSGQGDEPQPPALMCMVLLLQGYLKVSDAEAVCLPATDRLWRLVLGTLAKDDDSPPFLRADCSSSASGSFAMTWFGGCLNERSSWPRRPVDSIGSGTRVLRCAIAERQLRLLSQ